MRHPCSRHRRSLLRTHGGRRAHWLLGALALGLSSTAASAQTDVNPPLPNVMLLVDTSGSMEYKVDGSAFPKCYPDGSQPSERSRWIDLVEVLTGTIQDYRCEAIDRSSASFLADYDANGGSGERPYDYLYVNPYHRPMNGTCVAVPGTLPTPNAYDFPLDNAATAANEGAIRYRHYTLTTNDCNFLQATDGVLDSFENGARFGLMTFDTLTSAATGVLGTHTGDYDNGLLGAWSYVVQPAMANPAGCFDAPLPFEVGARNAAAPPWEGRMVAFGNTDAGDDESFLKRKSQIEQILLATRPYGGTPIAGMLHDARDFFLNDDTADPLDSSLKFGPKDDPYVKGGCRDQFIILLTDGQPNLEMRPHCVGGPPDARGVCPFDKPETLAAELVSEANIETLVVPFALPTFELAGEERNCNDLEDADFDELDTSRPCGDPANADNVALQACCALNRIAVAGSMPTAGSTAAPPRAYFAEDKQELASQLSSILSSRARVTSRTQPVISGRTVDSVGLRFFSLVRPSSLAPWVGILQRQRFECNDENVAEPVEFDANAGDDFGQNMAANPSSRVFATIQASSGTGDVDSTHTIRPFYEPGALTDGAGAHGGTRVIGDQDDFISGTSAASMALTDGICDDGLNANQCRDRYLRWLVGLSDQHGNTHHRCRSASDCNLLGDILHSTPRIVGPPSDGVRDETYDAFELAQAERPVVLYTSTNDGFLHAFKVAGSTPEDAVKTKANNELWAFVPPAVLPRLRSQYPHNHQELLDGAPVVKDVVATHAANLDVDALRFERSGANAELGANALTTWRTVLVQSFGGKHGGYFALDVTDPVPASNGDKSKGPRFLWQLTTDESGAPLFGLGGATPVITTLFFTPTGASAPVEVAVAVLPGGRGGDVSAGPTGAGCPETARTFPDYEALRGFTARGRVRCYSGPGVGGRSLTVVRLDNGEIIRTFRQSEDEITNADLRERVTEVDIDSPITGQPVAFPGATGAVANRVYVGDQDGRLWRVDLSSTNPEQWNMDLFFDAFPASYDSDSNMHDFDDGQPILTAPVLSTDEAGNVTVNLSTGDQDTIGYQAGLTNYVWSLTEQRDANGALEPLKVNWFEIMPDGERVTGPLVLFNSQLFFSSFVPANPGADLCTSGTSRVWGMDYLRPRDLVNANPRIDEGGAPRLPRPPEGTLVQFLDGAAATGQSGAVVFGVSVAQLPTCSKVVDEPVSDFFGNYRTASLTDVNPGQFQLVMHMGGVQGTLPSGSAANSVATLPTQAPSSSVRVESWAALLE